MPELLTENDVIEAVEHAFVSRKFALVGKCNTTKRGVDLHVRHEVIGSEWLIEAKGGTSSKENSSKYGEPFDTTQVGVHVAKAIHQAMSLRAKYPVKRIGIALPDEKRHRREIAAVGDALDLLRITVIWVNSDGVALLPDTL